MRRANVCAFLLLLLEMGRTFAIGDIHGCSRTFQKLVQEKIRLSQDDALYLIGDYIDRGPDSRGVVDFIMRLRQQGHAIFTLRGNHEQMMLDALHDRSVFKLWMQNGGASTLKSFRINSPDQMEEKYWNFFHETLICIDTNEYIFVHAGLNFKRPNIFEDKEAMLWTRDEHCNKEALGTRVLVHGHTPKPLSEIIVQQENCINIDGGCVFQNHFELGNLVAVQLPAKRFIWPKFGIVKS